MTRLVTHDAMSEALNYLATSSRDCAAARGMRVRLEFKRKRVRAKLILASQEKTAAAREAEAECHPDYVAACEAEADAVVQDEFFRCERNKSDTIISCWQTENANARAGSSFR